MLLPIDSQTLQILPLGHAHGITCHSRALQEQAGLQQDTEVHHAMS